MKCLYNCVVVTMLRFLLGKMLTSGFYAVWKVWNIIFMNLL